MRKARRILSFLLIFTIITTLFNGLAIIPANAEMVADLNLGVLKDLSNQYTITDTSVTLSWSSIPGAASYIISRDDLGVSGDITVTENTYSISNLLPNCIYNFTVQAKDDVGNTIDTTNNQLNVLTGSVGLSCANIGGESNVINESGVNPGLKLQWSIPKIWNGSQFATIDSDKIDYLVSVGTDKGASNIGNYKVYYNGGSTTSGYDVVKQGEAPVSKLIKDADITNGILSYEWWRYKDLASKQLNDDSLKPGTVYYLKVYPQFNTTANNPNNISIGNTVSKASSLLNGYVCTPLHVIVGRDGNNNLKCTIDRINYDSANGSDVINFRYEVYSSPDSGMMSSTLEGYQYEQYGDLTKPIEIYIPNKSGSATYYYKVYAKSDNLDAVGSSAIQYDMSQDEIAPPIPQNVTVEDTKVVTDGNQTGASVSLRWSKPSAFNNDQLRYYLMVSLNKEDMTTTGGVYYKEVIDGTPYDIRYRTVAVLDNSNLDFSEAGYVKCTINGLQLLQDYDNFGDNYPAKLRLNKVYYLKLYSEKISTGSKSDFSLPINFTAPGETRKLPVPEAFGVETVTTDQIGLIWQKTDINQDDYNIDNESDYSVTYDIYISDSIAKDNYGNYNSFMFLGNYPDTASAGLNYNIRRAQISSFSNQNVSAKFGDSVKPNTTYYFMIRQKLNIQGVSEPVYSDFSYVVSVTTKKGDITEPDDSTIKPKALVDFGVDADEDGNPKIERDRVTLKWTKQQDKVTYRLIRTSKTISENADLATIQADTSYNFSQYTLLPNLEPDSSGKYTYTADGLQPNTIYYFSIRAERTLSDGSTIYSAWVTLPVTTDMLEAPTSLEVVSDSSINVYSQLKVKWIANENYGYQVWLKSESQNDYSQYTSVSISYSKPASLQGTNLRINYAVISNLKSNTSYYIKVRNTYRDSINNVTELSKLAGPVSGRTEFKQSDYDDQQQQLEDQTFFNQSIKDLENGLYWIIDNDNDKSSIKLRASMVINKMMYDNSNSLNINIGYFERNPDDENDNKVVSNDKEVIIPYSIIEYINSNKETLAIQSSFGTAYIKPGTFDDKNSRIAEMKKSIADSDIDDIYIRLKFENLGQGTSNLPTSNKDLLASEVTGFTVEVLGMDNSEEKIEKEIEDEVSDIVKDKCSDYVDKSESAKDTQAEISALIAEYRSEIIEKIGEFVNDEIDNSTDKGPETVSSLSDPIGFSYQYNPSTGVDYYTAYLYTNNTWNKIPATLDSSYNTANFEIKKPGKLAILKKTSEVSSENAKNNQQLVQLDMKYDIASILTDKGTFDAKEPITVMQIMAVIGKVLGQESSDEQLASKLGVNSRFKQLSDLHELTREEAAYLAMRMYALETGISDSTYKPSKIISFSDYKDIDPAYYNAVLMATDLKVINSDENKRILPKQQISAGNMLIILTRVLSLLGEL